MGAPANVVVNDDLLTLKQIADMHGLKKSTVRRFIDDESDPLPHERNDEGWIVVRREAAEDYISRHPVKLGGNPREIDRVPVDGGRPGAVYLTVKEAAARAGLSSARIQAMTLDPERTLPTKRNAAGWKLIDEEELDRHLEARGRPPESPEPAFDFSYWPELAGIPGTYGSIQEMSDATNIGYKIIAQWTNDPVFPLPYVGNTKRFINKYRFCEYLREREKRSAAHAAGLMAVSAL